MREKEEQGKKKPSGSAMRGVRGEPGGAAMAGPGWSWRGRSNDRTTRRRKRQAIAVAGENKRHNKLREW